MLQEGRAGEERNTRGARAALYLLLPLALVGFLVWRRLGAVRAQAAEASKGASGRKGKAASVDAAVAAPARILSTLVVVGSATPPNTVRLSPRVAGRIVAVTVRPGDRVAAGQALVRLDPAQAEALVAQARATLAQATSRLAEARATAGATAVGLGSAVRREEATLAAARATAAASRGDLASQIAGSKATLADFDARVAAAEADVLNARAGIGAAEANLQNAQARFRRTERLFQGGFIAAQDLDDARAAVAVQEAAIAQARATVEGRARTAAALRQQRAAAAAQNAAAERAARLAIATNEATVRGSLATLAAARSSTAGIAAYRSNLAALAAAEAAARAGLRQAEATRADLVLVSPIAGTVTERAADPGGLASPGTPILTVVDLRRTLFTAGIPAEEGAAIAPGVPASIEFDGLPGRKFSASVTRVNRAADLATRQFGIEIALANPDESIRPGSFGRATLTLRKVEAAVAVPIAAVKSGRATVIGPDGTVEPRDVRTGARDARVVQILEGVAAGERVVTLASSPPREGQKVKAGGSR